MSLCPRRHAGGTRLLLRALGSALSDRVDRAEEPVRLVVRAGTEQQGARAAGGRGPEAQAPQAVNGDGLLLLVEQLAGEPAADRVEGADPPIPEATDEQVAAEGAESGRCLSQAPRRVEDTARGQALHQEAVRREYVNEAAARAGHVVVLRGVLLGVRHVEEPVDLLDPERSVARDRQS